MALAQELDLLIKGGHVIDPKNGLDAIADVGIADGKIARIAPDIPITAAQLVVDASGLIVTPGLVDLHVHPDFAAGGWANPIRVIDGYTFRTCVTTAVDAGTHGWRSFSDFKTKIIDLSETHLLAFINIVGHGMQGAPLEQNVLDMEPKQTARTIEEYRDLIVGVKTAHYRGPDWRPVDRAIAAGELAGVPIMVDFGRFAPERPYAELVAERLRPGDISTHVFNGRTALVDDGGRLQTFVREAQGRGVIFDVGHGGGSFVFRQAIPAIKEGFRPNTISTDLHPASMNAGMKDLANVMSKFLNMGMTLQEIIVRTTWNTARVIQREDLGHLSEGAEADVAVLRVLEGQFGFVDVERARMTGGQKLECQLTVRRGEVVWDLNGLSSPRWEAVARLREGRSLARSGQLDDAVSAYQEAVDLDRNLFIEPEAWEELCWQGSLWGRPETALPYCERVLERTPERTSAQVGRGLALALLGRLRDAVADLQAYVASIEDEELRQMWQGWLEALEGGENPFTPAILESLRSM